MLEVGAAGSWIRQYLYSTRGEDWRQPPYGSDLMLRFFGDCLDSLNARVDGVRLIVIQSPYAEVETVRGPDKCYIVYDQGFREVWSSLNRVYLHACKEPEGQKNENLEEPPQWWIRMLYANRFLCIGRNSEALINALLARDARSSLQIPELSEDDIHTLNTWEFIQEAFVIAHELGHCRIDDDEGILAGALEASFNELVRDFAIYIDGQSERPPDPRIEYFTKMKPFVEKLVSEFQSEEKISDEERVKLRDYLNGVFREMRDLYDAIGGDDSVQSQLDWLLGKASEFGEEILSDYFALYLVTRILGNRVVPFDDCIVACYLASMHIHSWRGLTLLATVSVQDEGDTDPTVTSQIIRESRTREFFFFLMGRVLSRIDHEEEAREAGLSYERMVRGYNERQRILQMKLSSAHKTHTEWVHNPMVMGVHYATQYAETLESESEWKATITSPEFPQAIASLVRIGHSTFSWDKLAKLPKE